VNPLEHSHSIYIRATPEQVWQALTDPALTTQYFFGGAMQSDWRVGSEYRLTSPDGANVQFDGAVLESEPGRRLVQSVRIKFNPAFVGHDEMSIAWDIEPFGEACRVTISHRGAPTTTQVFAFVTSHCADLLSGMKTLLETGTPLRIDQPSQARPHV